MEGAGEGQQSMWGSPVSCWLEAGMHTQRATLSIYWRVAAMELRVPQRYFRSNAPEDFEILVEVECS